MVIQTRFYIKCWCFQLSSAIIRHVFMVAILFSVRTWCILSIYSAEFKFSNHICNYRTQTRRLTMNFVQVLLHNIFENLTTVTFWIRRSYFLVRSTNKILVYCSLFDVWMELLFCSDSCFAFRHRLAYSRWIHFF